MTKGKPAPEDHLRHAFKLARRIVERPENFLEAFVVVPLDPNILKSVLSEERIRMLDAHPRGRPVRERQRAGRVPGARPAPGDPGPANARGCRTRPHRAGRQGQAGDGLGPGDPAGLGSQIVLQAAFHDVLIQLASGVHIHMDEVRVCGTIFHSVPTHVEELLVGGPG